MMKEFLDLLLFQSIPSPESQAIISKDKSFTYGELNQEINSTASKLKRFGIQKNDHAAVISENNIEYIILVLALWKIGAVPVPINIRLLNDEIETLIYFADCKFVFVQQSFKLQLKDKSISKIVLPFSKDNSSTAPIEDIFIKESDLALLMFTSGSSGTPKAVMLTFNNLIQSAVNGYEFFNPGKNDHWLTSLPFFHIGGFSIIVRAILSQGTLVVPEILSQDSIERAIVEFNPSFISLVTTQLKRILEKDMKPNPGLKKILLGGGFIEENLVRNALTEKWIVAKSYGSTETSSFVTALEAKDFEINPSSAGKAFSKNEIKIIDEKGMFLPVNTLGEVVIRGGSVSKGYYKNHEETKLKFKNGFYYSGDYGYLDENGFLYIEARRTDLIISGGENINPVEVENEIHKFSKVKEVCVLGIDNKDWGHIVTASIISKDKTKFSLDELRNFLYDKLPGYKHPRKIFFFEEFPKTPLGKIQKEKLKQMILEML